MRLPSRQCLHRKSIVGVILAMSSAAITSTLGQYTNADCVRDEDWPDKPCLDEPPYSEEYLRQIWQQYYEYKGKGWMEAKKVEMDMSIQNDSLKEWIDTRTSETNFANNNVWFYYYLNGQAPYPYVQTDRLIERVEQPQNQAISSAASIIGIGAAIAGVVAFLTLRKKRK